MMIDAYHYLWDTVIRDYPMAAIHGYGRGSPPMSRSRPPGRPDSVSSPSLRRPRVDVDTTPEIGFATALGDVAAEQGSGFRHSRVWMGRARQGASDPVPNHRTREHA